MKDCDLLGGIHDQMAEWSKALELGCLRLHPNPKGRGFEPHSDQ